MSLVPWMLVLVAGASAPRDAEVARHLAELGAPGAAERARAERWLAAHLGPGDREAVARAAVAADAEARRRLARAIGAERRSLALAAQLTADAEPAAVEVGLDAVRELALAWAPALAAAPVGGDGLGLALLRGDAARSVRLLSADVGAPLADVLDLLRRSGAAPVGLVLDPASAERAAGRAAAGAVPYVAAWSQLAGVLAGVHGFAVEGFGLDADAGGLRGDRGAFLVFGAPRPPAQAPEPGLARLQAWVRAVAGGGPSGASGTGRRRRMEALLATGWPAAWEWIGALDAAGDAQAGEALVGAASAGMWPPAWRDAGRVNAWLAQLRVLQASGFEPRAGLLARALASAPARLADGTATAELFGAAWEGAAAPERRQLLVALEGVAATGSPAARAAWEARLRALFAGAGADPALLRQALRAWCAAIVGPETAPLEIAASLALLDAPWGEPERRELGGLLRRSKAVPPTKPIMPIEIGARATLADWLAGGGSPEPAGALLAASLESLAAEASFAALLRRMVARGDGDEARGILAAAAARAADDDRRARVARTAFRAGLAAADERAAHCAAAAASDDLELVRAAAGTAGDAGDAARARLVELLGAALAGDSTPDALLPALQAVEGAMADLLRVGADGDAGDLRRRAAGRVLAGKRGGMRERLASAGWPQMPPPLDVVELELLRRP